MATDMLRRIVELAKKSGDRIIVTDPSGNDAFVLMNLDQYERLLGQQGSVSELTQGELVSKINQDIATWRAHQEDQGAAGWESVETILSNMRNSDGLTLAEDPEATDENANFSLNKDKNEEAEDTYYFEPIE